MLEHGGNSIIESAMYTAIGFIVASLLTIVIIPSIHARAVRLSMRSIKATVPQSIAEVQADKDQLRAAFAMSTRRLGIGLADLQTKIAGLMAELGRRNTTINDLKIELSEKLTAMIALETRNKTLNDRLCAAEQELSQIRVFSRDEDRIYHAIDGIRSPNARPTNELKVDRAMRV